MLEIGNLTVKYEEQTVLKNVSLNVEENEIVALVGESGSGKTTVIRTILDLLPSGGNVVEGKILFCGQSLSELQKRQWEKLRGSEIAMIFQDSGSMLNPIRRIGSQFVEYILSHQTCSKQEAKEMAKDMIEKMGLPNPENMMRSYPFQLSGGQRQRIGIAMAMTFRPKLLLADEPTSALDVTTQAQIVKQMMELKKTYHTSILLITHNLAVANYMADRIYIMKDGEIVDEGRKDYLLSSENPYTKQLIQSIPSLGGKSYV